MSTIQRLIFIHLAVNLWHSTLNVYHSALNLFHSVLNVYYSTPGLFHSTLNLFHSTLRGSSKSLVIGIKTTSIPLNPRAGAPLR